MSFKKVLLFFIMAFILQLSVVGVISIGNYGPNLILCVMIIITFLYEDGYRSIPFAIFTGLILDICSGIYVGITPLLMLVCGIFATAARIWLNTEKIHTLITTVIIATVMYDTLYFTAQKILGDPHGIGYVLKQEPFYILYNVAVCSVMFLVMHKKAEEYHNDRYTI